MGLESIKKIAVAGSGLMGNGIAQVVAAAGFDVIFFDISMEVLGKGFGAIQKRIDKEVSKGKRTEEDAKALMGRFALTSDYEDLAQADFLFEVIYERMDIKEEFYKKVDAICKPECIFASNTSSLSITSIAACTNRSDKVIGTHFFNPVPIMKLIEVINGYDTSEETYKTTMAVCEKMGKETITVKEAPLFCVNRILVPMLNEAIFVLNEGIATKEDIDKGMMLGCNMPQGPLALADMVGLDTLLLVAENLYQETYDSKYRPSPLLVKMVRAGHYGKKTGRGFYNYT